MAKAICIIGESGAGKTTSLRNLNPQQTYYIDADKKGSAWRGFRKQYNAENKNYIATDDGYTWTRMKTTGKKTNKLVPESKFNVVLLAKCKEGRYIFETHSNNSTAKTPLDAFEEDEIENDIVPVLEVLEEY